MSRNSAVSCGGSTSRGQLLTASPSPANCVPHSPSTGHFVGAFASMCDRYCDRSANLSLRCRPDQRYDNWIQAVNPPLPSPNSSHRADGASLHPGRLGTGTTSSVTTARRDGTGVVIACTPNGTYGTWRSTPGECGVPFQRPPQPVKITSGDRAQRVEIPVTVRLSARCIRG